MKDGDWLRIAVLFGISGVLFFVGWTIGRYEEDEKFYNEYDALVPPVGFEGVTNE